MTPGTPGYRGLAHAEKAQATPADVPPRAADEQILTESQLDEVLTRLNRELQEVQHSLEFSIDEDSGRQVIKVIDTETDEVIRQFPPEELLMLARRMEDYQGVMFDEQG